MLKASTHETVNRPVRNQEREIGAEQCRAILEKADHGVLATAGLDASPYAVPLSFILKGDALYVHGSGIGHRNENIGKNPRVCFCVVGSTQVRPELFDRDYESVVVFGRARAVVGDEKRAAMEAFLSKYCADNEEEGRKRLDRGIDRIFVIRIAIEHMTGKAHRAVAGEEC